MSQVAMLRKFIVFLAVLIVFAQSGVASAHVLVTDTSEQVGAILHITPDDDPVAGQSGDIFYDIQQAADGLSNVSLRITDTDNTVQQVPVIINGSTVRADYIFPSQGVYRIDLTATVAGQRRLFEHSQRVARGSVTTTTETGGKAWGEAVFIFSVAGLCVLLILAFNRLRYTKENISRK